jgi:hypothetical protein
VKLFFACLIFFFWVPAFSQRGLVLADRTIVYSEKLFDSDSISCLSFGNQISVIEAKHADQTVKVEFLSDNAKHIVGWVNKDHILYESSSGEFPVYILSDSIRLYVSPSNLEKPRYVLPNKTYGSDYIFISASLIEFAGQQSGWSRIRLDSITAWIEDSLIVPASFISLIDSAGKEIGRRSINRIGIMRDIQKDNENNLVVHDYNTIASLDPASLNFSKQYFCSSLHQVNFLYNSSSFLVNQLIRNTNPPNTFTSRLFFFDPQRFSVKKIIDTSAIFWPSNTLFVPPNEKSFYFLKGTSWHQYKLIKTDDRLSVLDTVTIDEISRYHTFLNNGTMLAILFKRGDSRVITLGYFDLNKMESTVEQDLTKHFVLPERPSSLSLDVVYYWNRYYFFYGRFRLKGESKQEERWRTVRWNIDKDVFEEVPFPKNIMWNYTPKTINGNILTFTNNVDRTPVIQEFDLESFQLVRTLKIESQRKMTGHRQINNKYYSAGDEGTGLYDDAIYKLSNGNYVILYSYHGD